MSFERNLRRRALLVFTAALGGLAAACGSTEAAPVAEGVVVVPIPSAAKKGDELVASVALTGVEGSWKDTANPGFVLELKLGENVARHVIVPGGDAMTTRVSLGAWDGGELRVAPRAGHAAFAVDVAVDPTAAGLPVMGLYNEEFWNDTPLGVYHEGDLYTYVFTNEDAGTGLFPTLLMAQYGRPVDIEGLLETGDKPTIQASGHNWIDFTGPYEGSHPLLQIATLNGLVGPEAGSTYRVSTMPMDFTTQGGAVPREQALDKEPWILKASFDEVTRQLQLKPDGGPEDAWIGAPDDYIFIDYDFESAGAVASFEAEVAGTFYSSLGMWTSLGALSDAHISGVGRTCIELPKGASPKDVTALKIVAAGSGSGTLKSARWFQYDQGLKPVEMGAAKSMVSVGDGFSPEAFLVGGP